MEDKSVQIEEVSLFIIGLGNGLVPVGHQAFAWTNNDLSSIGSLGTDFRGIWMKTKKFSDNGLALNKPKASTWANDGQVLTWPQ